MKNMQTKIKSQERVSHPLQFQSKSLFIQASCKIRMVTNNPQSCQNYNNYNELFILYKRNMFRKCTPKIVWNPLCKMKEDPIYKTHPAQSSQS